MRVLLVLWMSILFFTPAAETAGRNAHWTDTSTEKVPPILTDDPAFVADAKAAVDSLYNLRYEDANRLLSSWKQRYPDHPLWKFWKAMNIWWHILPDLQNRTLDDTLYATLQSASDKARDILDRDPDHRDALLIHALSKGLMARQYANREKWFTSINQGRKAIRALRNLTDLNVRIPDLLLGRGLLNYYAAYLPEAYPIIRTVSWMLPGGDKAEGLRQMKVAADSSIYMRPEARYFIGKIYMSHEDQPRRALPYFEELYEQYPRNVYYSRQLIRAMAKTGRDEETLTYIEQMLGSNGGPFEAVVREELLAWKGFVQFQNQEYVDAEQNLRDSYIIATSQNLPQERARPFHTMTGYYLGRIFELREDTTRSLNYYRSVADADPPTHYSRRAEDRIDRLQ